MQWHNLIHKNPFALNLNFLLVQTILIAFCEFAYDVYL
jgi:hypothetical protein